MTIILFPGYIFLPFISNACSKKTFSHEEFLIVMNFTAYTALYSLHLISEKFVYIYILQLCRLKMRIDKGKFQLCQGQLLMAESQYLQSFVSEYGVLIKPTDVLSAQTECTLLVNCTQLTQISSRSYRTFQHMSLYLQQTFHTTIFPMAIMNNCNNSLMSQFLIVIFQ